MKKQKQTDVSSFQLVKKIKNKIRIALMTSLMLIYRNEIIHQYTNINKKQLIKNLGYLKPQWLWHCNKSSQNCISRMDIPLQFNRHASQPMEYLQK